MGLSSMRHGTTRPISLVILCILAHINSVRTLNVAEFDAPVPDASSWIETLRGQNNEVRARLPLVVINPIPPYLRPALVFVGMIRTIPAVSVGPFKILLPLPLTCLVKRSNQFNQSLVKTMIQHSPRGILPALTVLFVVFQYCHEVAKLSARLELVLSLF